jgi:hypothetical protein
MTDVENFCDRNSLTYNKKQNATSNVFDIHVKNSNVGLEIPGDQKGLFKLAVELRKFFNSVIYNTAPGYVLLVYLTNI